MRVFRKIRKVSKFDGAAEHEPLPDVVYQMAAEAAVRYARQDPYGVGRSTTGAGDIYGLSSAFPYPPVPMAEVYDGDQVEDNYMYEQPRASSPVNLIRSALGRNRSRSHERYLDDDSRRFSRPGSPEHMAQHPVGSPRRFRSRPGSPELVRSRPGSPHRFEQRERMNSPVHFESRSRPSSPAAIQRIQLAKLSQDLQRAEHLRRQQEQLQHLYQGQFMPSYAMGEPEFYQMNGSHGFGLGWPLVPQQSVPNYSYF